MVQGQLPKSIAWTHVTICVSDLERSIEFYQSYCNLIVVRDVRKDGGSTVWLGHAHDPAANPNFVLVLLPGEIEFRLNHLGFQCESKEQVDEIAEKAKAAGCLDSGPAYEQVPILGYWVWIKDPDGNIVEFTAGQPLQGIS